MTCRPFLVAALLVPLAACGSKTEPDTATNTVETTTTTGVDRQVVKPPEEAEPAPIQQAVIQTQPGPEGSQVALNKVAVTGDVLTVQVTYSGAKGWSYPPVEDISVIDDATAQRIGVLKDNAGKPLASPLDGEGKKLWVNLSRSPVIAWFKFPAPAATSKTVSVNIPEVAPFDGVPVTR